ncbi:unnamed protein product [Caenorhabditis bovis]|uniref:WAP domain-containing protein n=1 Tax=Caenorhabditis bovis TaxID=2654633 RepID=A0A8S1EQX2_9PELO|nr:unnamed protein product [Caenorhabditis bovis]
MSSKMLIFFLIATNVVADTHSNKLSWCEYWQKRGIQRPECLPPRVQHWSIAKTRHHEKTGVLSMPICDTVTDWSRCQKSNHCPLGLLCWRRGSPCCTPQLATSTNFGTDQCPVPKTLGITCNTRNPINWCNSDHDCHRSSETQKCCPTGCGYNMCLHSRPCHSYLILVRQWILSRFLAFRMGSVGVTPAVNVYRAKHNPDHVVQPDADTMYAYCDYHQQNG